MNAFRTLGEMQVVELAPGEKVEDAALRYMSSGLVEFAEPDYKIHASNTPNDPEFVGGTQWSLRNSTTPGHDISAVAGWETLNSASNIIVAVVDSGIRYTHDDLAANIWTNSKEIPNNAIDDDNNGIVDDIHGINAINSTGEVMDDLGHGTHVAGIIGAVGNNGIGITGVAWKVQLMACKFLDSSGDGDTSDALQCVDYARRMGASIINASWGGSNFSAALNMAISNARAAGVILVTAAGNDSQNIDSIPIYPACYTLDNIVAVGSTVRSDTLDSSSSYGPLNVDLCAPGSGIWSTWNSWDGAYQSSSGTSMAAPHVAGVLALMKARFPSFTSSQLIARLYATVDVLPSLSGKCKTGGRVNLNRALGTDPAANFTASTLSGEPPLPISFTNLTLGALKSIVWDFGDGTPVVTNSDPTHVFAETGSFNVKLTVVGTNNRTNSFEQIVQVTENYEIKPESYSWIDPAGMESLSLTDNGVSAPLPLPFSFRFYGEAYDSLYVGANGVVGFSASGLSTTDNTFLPNSGAPNRLLCPYWDNLNPAAGGKIYAGVTGAAPFRRFVVSWVDVPRNSSAVPLSFQVVLEEGSNEAVFQYLEVQPASDRGAAKRATVGVENATGAVAALYTYNGSPRTLTNQTALRITIRPYRYLVTRAAALELKAVKGLSVVNVTGTLPISNPGTLELEWSIESTETWLDLPERSGRLPAGGNLSLRVRLSPEAEALPVGTYAARINLKNSTDGGGNTSLPVQLIVEKPRSQLTAQSVDGFIFSGGLGGPFNPSSLTIELRNNGNVPLQWSSSKEVAWLVVSPALGALRPGETSQVVITLNGVATDLPSGPNDGVVRFENKTDPAAPVEEKFQVDVRTKVQASAAVVNGVFQGEVSVPAGTLYQVEYSEDLVNWFQLDLTPNVVGTKLTFEDPVGADSRRFYRVRVE